MRGNRMRNPFEQVFGTDCTGERRADRFVSVVRDQYFAGGGFPLQPCGNVNAVADHRVIVAVGRSHVGRERRPRGDADAHPQNDPIFQLGIDVVHGLLYPECRADGAKHMIVVLNGDVKQRHDRIA